MTEQEIAAKEKQQVEGQEKTRAGRFFLPSRVLRKGWIQDLLLV